MKSTMKSRAAALAEEMTLFTRPRMWSLQIPGLAELLVTFAENELRLAGVGAQPVADSAEILSSERSTSDRPRDRVQELLRSTKSSDGRAAAVARSAPTETP